MMNTNFRIKIIDILRGWALLIVIICNYTGFAYDDQHQVVGKGIVIEILRDLEEFLFSAKGWSLLFGLFGFGFGVFMEKFQGNSYLGFAKRMLVLFCFALVNSLIYDGDILRDYVFLGLLIIFFYKLNPKQLLIISLVILFFIPFLDAFINGLDTSFVDDQLAVIAPLRLSRDIVDLFRFNFWSSYYYEVINLGYSVTAHCVMFVCMLLGLWTQKTNWFRTVFSDTKKVRIFVRIFFITSLFLVAILIFSFKQKDTYLNYFSVYYWLVLSTMMFTVSSICWLFLSGYCKKVFCYFSFIGRMTLTNYMVQNVISFFVFQGFGLRLFSTMPYYFYYLFAIAIFVLQIIFSIWWLGKHRYGPLEILWRKWSGTVSKA